MVADAGSGGAVNVIAIDVGLVAVAIATLNATVVHDGIGGVPLRWQTLPELQV
jgi:hypothetical protein